MGLDDPQVAVSFPDVSGKQVIAGSHLVRPDGTVSLGIYGSVYVSGMTLDEVKGVVEHHLADQVKDPEVNVDVLGYNSKVYYCYLRRWRIRRERDSFAIHRQRNRARCAGRGARTD